MLSNSEKYFKEICLRCENHAKNMTCEDMQTCPVYKLYLIAKSKEKIVYKNNNWNVPQPPPTGWI